MLASVGVQGNVPVLRLYAAAGPGQSGGRVSKMVEKSQLFDDIESTTVI